MSGQWTVGGRPAHDVDGRIVEHGATVCVHNVGLTPGLWCGGCKDAIAAAAVPPGPADGHTFRVLFDIRGSAKVVGDPEYTDDREFAGLYRTFEVRGWSLAAALRNAADNVPFAELMAEPDDYKATVRALLTAAVAISRDNGYVAKDHAGGPHHYSDEWLLEQMHEVLRD